MNASKRLDQLLIQIAEIGRDQATGGYNRFAYTETDLQLRAFFAQTAEELGLEVGVDAANNQWAWWGDPDSDPEHNLVLGSHLDSVPSGGAYDGPLGVLSALSAIAELIGDGFQPRSAVGVANFIDEEGARFGVACLGSRVLTGETTYERLSQLIDYDGTPFVDVVSATGVDPTSLGRDDRALSRIGSFIELLLVPCSLLRRFDPPQHSPSPQGGGRSV